MSVTALMIAAALFVVAFAISVLSNWLSARLPTLPVRYLVVGILALAVASLAVGVVQHWQPNPPGLSEPTGQATQSGLAAIAPDLMSRILLLTDDSSGAPVMFAERLDGTDRERLADFGGPLTVIPKSLNVLVAWSDGAGQSLQVRSDTGQLIRKLTRPPHGYTDTSPTLASDVGVVYFIREQVRNVGDGTSVLLAPRLMRVPLDGSVSASPVRTSEPLDTVSVDDSGSLLAGQCSVDDPGNVGQACTVSPRTGILHHIPGSQTSTMSDVTVSPDGTMIAYSSFSATPFGGSQVFVFNVRHGSTTDLSQLPGVNDQPAWAPPSTHPCLAFRHDSTGQNPVIYLGCLTPAPRAAPAIPVGAWPAWLAP
jgi:hypothetical protein